jgi:trimethylamine--corrinoid protein Co-methyltransferase
MLDFLACHSIEKLVIDTEAIASAQRPIEGIQPSGVSLAVDMFAQTGLQGDCLKLKETRTLFRKEQHFPSAVIDRGLPSPDGITPDILQRARHRVDELLAAYERHTLADEAEQELITFAQREAMSSGLEGLPGSSATNPTGQNKRRLRGSAGACPERTRMGPAGCGGGV